MVVKRRLDLKVGFLCNNRCRFCVQGDKRYRYGEKTKEQVMRELKEAREKGIREVVFTGGEPTIHPNIIELVKYASELGYKRIQIQTNGRTLAVKGFVDALVEAGANEFSPALHGHIPQLHDFLTRSPGSWRQTVRGIKNVKEYGLPVITNTVVTKPNYRFLGSIAELLVKLGVDQYQFAFVHALGEAWKNFDSIVPRISLAAPYIHTGLQVGIDAGIPVMAEAMPFCLMPGYEPYVSELYIPPAIIYDANFVVEKYEKWRVTEGKLKREECKKCKFYRICEGPWREYPERRGWDEFVPVPGDYVTRDEVLKKKFEESLISKVRFSDYL